MGELVTRFRGAYINTYGPFQAMTTRYFNRLQPHIQTATSSYGSQEEKATQDLTYLSEAQNHRKIVSRNYFCPEIQ